MGAVPVAPVMPRLLSFYRDVVDDAGTVTGWQTIAWGLALSDGSVVSTPVGPPASVTLWSCLEDAAKELDASDKHDLLPDDDQATVNKWKTAHRHGARTSTWDRGDL